MLVKTGAKPAIKITGELVELIERINGRPLGEFGLRSPFAKARKRAGVEFQFRDIRAKAATDTGVHRLRH